MLKENPLVKAIKQAKKEPNNQMYGYRPTMPDVSVFNMENSRFRRLNNRLKKCLNSKS